MPTRWLADATVQNAMLVAPTQGLLASPPSAVGVRGLDMVGLDLAEERADVDAKVLGRQLAIAIPTLERFGDEQFLNLRQTHRLSVWRLSAGGGPELRRQVAQFNDSPATENKGLLDNVLQFANVSGEIVVHQPGQHPV